MNFELIFRIDLYKNTYKESTKFHSISQIPQFILIFLSKRAKSQFCSDLAYIHGSNLFLNFAGNFITSSNFLLHFWRQFFFVLCLTIKIVEFLSEGGRNYEFSFPYLWISWLRNYPLSSCIKANMPIRLKRMNSDCL